MSDVPMSQTTIPSDAIYEASVEQLLREVQQINISMQNNQVEIDRLRAETKTLKARYSQLEAEGRETIARLKAAL